MPEEDTTLGDIASRQASATRILVALAAAQYLLVELISALAAVVFVSLTHDPAMAGLAPGLVFSSAAAVSVLAGRLSDRRGRQGVLACACVLASCGAAGFALAIQLKSVGIVVGASILAGAGIGGLRIVKAAAADLYPGRRSVGIGIVQSGAILGALVGPALAVTGVMDAPGKTIKLWLITAAILLAASAVSGGFLTAKRLGYRPERTDSQRLVKRKLSHLLAGRRLKTLFAGIFLIYGVMVMDMSLSGQALSIRRQDVLTIALVLAVHFVGMFGPMRIAGRVAAFMNRPILAGVASATVAAGSIGLGVGPVSPLYVGAMLCIVGAGWCFAWMAGLAELMETARDNERGAAVRIADFGSDALAAIIAISGGALLAGGGLLAMGVLGAVGAGLAGAGMLVEGRRTPQDNPIPYP